MKYFKYACLAVIAGVLIYAAYAYIGFTQKGLDTGLVSQTGAQYPDWGTDIAVLEADRNILNRDHLFFSKAYFIQRSDSYQLRFRIACPIPFFGDSLFQDTDWIKLEDSHGNDYSACLTAYPSEIAGLNCIDVTLVMDADTFSELSGGKLTVSAVCAKNDSTPEDRYAGCEAEILIPQID